MRLVRHDLERSAAAIFRDYDRLALDRQYNNLLKVPAAALERFRLRWSEESDAAKAAISNILDRPYGPTALEKLDIYKPSGAGPWPVVIYIHGGYWRSGDKAESGYIARAFSRDNILTVVINYGLVPATPISEQVQHCISAVIWVRNHIREYGGDPDRLFVIGHSAGAHLAAMLIAVPKGKSLLPEGTIKGICALSGIYDLEPVRLSYVNDSLHIADEDVTPLSPVRHNRQRDVPIFFAVGACEGDEYIRQTVEIAARWTSDPGKVELLITEDDNHFSIRSGWDEPGNKIYNRIRALIGSRGAIPPA